MLKILTIDDDPIIQMILKKTLSDQGYTVITAQNGEEGVLKAKQFRPALVICDWLMPGIDGLEVCRQIKAELTLFTTFFILLTSRSEVADRVEGLDTGADDFLAKPIEVNELKARVRAGLRLYQAAEEMQKLAQDLQTQKQRMEAELAEAASYVKSLLPAPLTGDLTTAAQFFPSKQLGGDCFDYYWLDPDYLVVYLLDVSGHGLGAALLSVSVQNLLRSQALPGINFYRPRDVLQGLNEIFQMSGRDARYFTIWYGVYNRSQHRLTYASAGHPPAILLSSQNEMAPVQKLKTRGAPIGMLPSSKYTSAYCNINASDILYIFSDGVYEVRPPNDTTWNLDSFIKLLELNHTGNGDLEQILSKIQLLTGTNTFEDDFSLLQIKFN
jgi:sigma-B regulation protein RsbU (phosphoserine phosphatase)